MKDYLSKDLWRIIEDGFHPEFNKISESIFSIGNGQFGKRGNFAESYSGETLLGNYVGGVYYPDKTKVGWWKNGYPEYFAKVLNACNWSGLKVQLGDELLDLGNFDKISNFYRELNMLEGTFTYKYTYTTNNGTKLKIECTQLCSLDNSEIGLLKYSINSINYTGSVSLEAFIDFDVVNEDSNYDEKFWKESSKQNDSEKQFIIAATKKTNFNVIAAVENCVFHNDKKLKPKSRNTALNYISSSFEEILEPEQTLTLIKYVSICSSRNHSIGNLDKVSSLNLKTAVNIGFEELVLKHNSAWLGLWHFADIEINGDIEAQQAIRFNIFQLYQTYTGEDARLNIGPKGFTGEKYGGSTYWDTEAYCLPFYLGTNDPKVARNLLIYRYNQLDKAIENAEKLGFNGGAALYPMVTMNGEECHNEWEITFEEIHRNGAIAYAIYDYIRYTDDTQYLEEYGIDVLVAISRFWAQRVNWSERKKMFVILGVTGPNEYENNVNNNWYTNYIAKWCLSYSIEVLNLIEQQNKSNYNIILNRLGIKDDEITNWKYILNNVYLPYDEKLGIHLQQDGFLDKALRNVSSLSGKDTPINQNWSWDRILRSCFIKQADVLQGMYFFEDDFNEEQHRSNFLFYEPMTVHESSLSPCVHSILASKLNMPEKAYEMYLRTSRLDLDDYNNDTEDGLHITSMAGTWMSIVKGFIGQRVSLDGILSVDPKLPKNWLSLKLAIRFKAVDYYFNVTHDTINIENKSANDGLILVGDRKVLVPAAGIREVDFVSVTC